MARGDMRFEQQAEALDGRQFAWNTLAEMGVTPGDMRDIMKELFENGDHMFLRQAAKGTTVEERQHNLNNPHSFEARREADEAHFEKKQDEHERWLERRQNDQRVFDEKRAFEEKLRQEDVSSRDEAPNRQAEDALNNQYMAMPFLAAGTLAWMGLSETAVSTTGQALSPHAAAIGDSSLVTSNNGGSLLADARAALNVGAEGNDALMTGPNLAFNFTPGQPLTAPELAPGMQPGGLQSPGLMQPKLTPDMA